MQRCERAEQLRCDPSDLGYGKSTACDEPHEALTRSIQSVDRARICSGARVSREALRVLTARVVARSWPGSQLISRGSAAAAL